MHFLFEPADRAGAKLDPLREAKIRLHLVNHRATETREATDLRQAQNPKRLACAPQLFGVGADPVDHPRRGPVDSYCDMIERC
jgi:hypothetical protein